MLISSETYDKNREFDERIRQLSSVLFRGESIFQRIVLAIPVTEANLAYSNVTDVVLIKAPGLAKPWHLLL